MVFKSFILSCYIDKPLKLMRLYSIVLGFCTIIIFSGCTPKVADIDVPYEAPRQFSLSGDAVIPAQWWRTFGDEKLDHLIDTALQSNLTLKTVWHQLEEARAVVDRASSTLLPQVDLELQSGISRPEPDFVGGENTQLSLGASYEVDLWGRIRYAVHAEKYRLESSYNDYKTAAISLSGEIALTWFRLKAARYQHQLVENQISTNEQVLSLIRARFASGQVKGVDILRQRQLIESTRTQKINLETQIEILKNQLSVLIGRPPGEPFEDIVTQLPELPPLPQTGIPLQLINRRPDVQSAFYRLQAADREVAVAISNKYPRLSLSLSGAIRSNTFSDLLQSQAVSLSASLLAPLFYGGRLSAEVDRTESVKQQRINEYGQIVLNAFQEVENSLIQETKQLERIDLIEEQINLAVQTYGQLRIEYLNGSIEYLDVLVSLNQEQQLRRDLINAELNLLEIRVGLYRALAGGFETARENITEDES